jgi:nitrogen-specific signal transduction histidine kinase
MDMTEVKVIDVDMSLTKEELYFAGIASAIEAIAEEVVRFEEFALKEIESDSGHNREEKDSASMMIEMFADQMKNVLGAIYGSIQPNAGTIIREVNGVKGLNS